MRFCRATDNPPLNTHLNPSSIVVFVKYPRRAITTAEARWLLPNRVMFTALKSAFSSPPKRLGPEHTIPFHRHSGVRIRGTGQVGDPIVVQAISRKELVGANTNWQKQIGENEISFSLEAMRYHQTGFSPFVVPDLFTEESIFYRFIGLRAVDWDWEHRQLSDGLQGEIYSSTRITMLKDGGSQQFHFNHTDLFQVPAPGIWLAASIAITSHLNQLSARCVPSAM